VTGYTNKSKAADLDQRDGTNSLNNLSLRSDIINDIKTPEKGDIQYNQKITEVEIDYSKQIDSEHDGSILNSFH